ncbi:MAG: molybdopterin dinucleotide binding domain-containing protein [Candidatus Hydrothermarchaeales archaeon]
MIILTKVTEMRLANMLKVTITTVRSIAQGEAIEGGKDKDDYVKAAAVCELDPEDMKKLGAKEGDSVKVSTAYGEVALKVVKSKQAPHLGLAVIPLGPWANSIMNPDTTATGMPSFKDVKGEIEVAKDAKVLSARELVRQLYMKFKQTV